MILYVFRVKWHVIMNCLDIVVGAVLLAQVTDCGLRSSAGHGSAAVESVDTAVEVNSSLHNGGRNNYSKIKLCN